MAHCLVIAVEPSSGGLLLKTKTKTNLDANITIIALWRPFIALKYCVCLADSTNVSGKYFISDIFVILYL